MCSVYNISGEEHFNPGLPMVCGRDPFQKVANARPSLFAVDYSLNRYKDKDRISIQTAYRQSQLRWITNRILHCSFKYKCDVDQIYRFKYRKCQTMMRSMEAQAVR